MSTNPEEVFNLLVAASSGDMNVMPSALARIGQLEQLPDYYSSLATLVASEAVDVASRQRAALQIKKGILQPQCLNNPSVQQAIMTGLTDSSEDVRKVMCAVVARGVNSGAWPSSVIDELLRRTQGTESAIEGPIKALSFIVEDNIEALDAEGKTGGIASAMVPLIASSTASLRASAVASCAILLEQAGVRNDCCTYFAMEQYIVTIVNGVVNILQGSMGTHDRQTTVNCVRTLVLSLAYTDTVFQVYPQLSQLMIQILQSSCDEAIKCEAVSFWEAVLYFPSTVDAARQQMGTVVPLLLRSIVYSDIELGMLSGKENDWQEPDRPEDIKPRHFQGRSHNFHNDRDDEDGQDDDDVQEWNLRRISAYTLDEIAKTFGDEILNGTLTEINAMMAPGQPWRVLEAAVLAIGAICEGCFDGLRPYMAQIASRLLDFMQGDFHFLVKQTACWSLGQMNDFVLDAANGQLLQRAVPSFLALMKSPSKALQEAATAAVGQLVEAAGKHYENAGALGPFMAQVVSVFSECLPNFQVKNKMILLESIESICSYYGHDLAVDANTRSALMTPLGRIWEETPNDSPLIYSFFQCMASVCSAFGRDIEFLAPQAFDRSVGMIRYHVQARLQAAAQGPDADRPEDEFLITSLDLLSGLLEALKSSMEPLLAQCPDFMDMLLAACSDESLDVRKAVFSVVGELCEACPGVVQRVLDQVCTVLHQAIAIDLTPHASHMTSNAAWCLSQLIEYQSPIGDLPVLGIQHMAVFFPALVKQLVSESVNIEMVNMMENVCLCIGRILLEDISVAPAAGIQLYVFASRWCEYVRNIKDCPMKERGLRGFLALALTQPSALQNALQPFWDVCLSSVESPQDIRQGLRQLLTTLKDNLGQQWVSEWSKRREDHRRRLSVTFNI